jgi:sugar phosphate isomerase/epimerase
MTMISRRSFSLSALSLGSLSLASVARADKLKSFGVQLYTVRNIIDKDPARVLHEIAAAGYKEIEAVYDDLATIWPAVPASHLKPVSVHVPTDLFLRTPEKLPAVLDDVKQKGFQYVVCPWIDPKDRGGVEMIRGLAKKLNAAGEQASRHGLKLCYHNHAFEFAPAGGGTLLDVLLKETDPKLVGWEMDIFWVAVTGNDPVDLMHRHPGRVALLHVKDIAPGVAKRFDEQVAPAAFKEAGAGTLNLKQILHAAEQAQVKHYFVEQDQTPGDPLTSLKVSASFLKTFEF